jgi:hypothetical protein
MYYINRKIWRKKCKLINILHKYVGTKQLSKNPYFFHSLLDAIIYLHNIFMIKKIWFPNIFLFSSTLISLHLRKKDNRSF